MALTERNVEITARDTGQKMQARLLVCPECNWAKFYCYFPERVDHLHFQCVACSTTFCDGCTEDAEQSKR